MSIVTFGSFGQAARTLDVVAEQKLSTEEVEVLNNGYLTDLARAIRMGTVPVRDAFQKFLGLLPELKIWKTIVLGLHKTPAEYEEALEKKGFRIGDWARQILRKITVLQTVVELDLCVLTVAELGFKGNARYDAICARIIEIGGQLCPNELGPALREQYPDQPYGEWDVIAMEAVTDSDGDLSVFRVGHGGRGQWLNTSYGNPEALFCPDSRVVFGLPRK
ncbi:MAG: hypothetical protein G01um10142_269 [Parcubacteria group bacterium Gr01-1014_2]|nr:MAG: hypothetical protein G01um10142_269 [Parcubacteria group bacterium Gr01-1014_2]